MRSEQDILAMIQELEKDYKEEKAKRYFRDHEVVPSNLAYIKGQIWGLQWQLNLLAPVEQQEQIRLDFGG